MGPGVRSKVCMPVVVHKEGGESPGAGSLQCPAGTLINHDQCVPPWGCWRLG